MSVVDFSKSYYLQHVSKSYCLHMLLHHAGDFMRALKKEGLTLGMMRNSSDRMSEYGRRASRKALASNAWRRKNPDYDNKTNLLVYMTIKEMMMWDYRKDWLVTSLGIGSCSSPWGGVM